MPTQVDRVNGQYTHELAIHHKAPDTLRVAAGDGYFESSDAGAKWRSPSAGLEVGYLRSVAIDPQQPEAIVVSASSGPYSAYVAGLGRPVVSPYHSRALGACPRRLAGASQHSRRTSALRRRESRRAVGRG